MAMSVTSCEEVWIETGQKLAHNRHILVTSCEEVWIETYWTL